MPDSTPTPSALPRPPGLVVFDVDGTLQDTFQWWHGVITRGLADFGRLHGLDVELPDQRTANAVVGFKDEQVWGPFLPEAHRHRWRELREHVVPIEVEELHSGADYLFAEVRELLGHLRARGVRVALASNCRSTYFAAVCEGQGLAALSDWQFCLDSRGGCSKTEMVRYALQEAAVGPEAAVMVGDRESDLEAARAAAVPFVWRVNDRCRLDADAHWHGSAAELLALLGLPAIS